MAGNGINIPQDLLRLFEVKMTTEPLRQFLTNLLVRVDKLEADKVALEARVKALETP